MVLMGYLVDWWHLLDHCREFRMCILRIRCCHGNCLVYPSSRFTINWVETCQTCSSPYPIRKHLHFLWYAYLLSNPPFTCPLNIVQCFSILVPDSEHCSCIVHDLIHTNDLTPYSKSCLVVTIVTTTYHSLNGIEWFASFYIIVDQILEHSLINLRSFPSSDMWFPVKTLGLCIFLEHPSPSIRRRDPRSSHSMEPSFQRQVTEA